VAVRFVTVQRIRLVQLPPYAESAHGSLATYYAPKDVTQQNGEAVESRGNRMMGFEVEGEPALIFESDDLDALCDRCARRDRVPLS